MIVLAV